MTLKNKIEEYISELEKQKNECEKYNADEMIGEAWVYDLVIADLKSMMTDTKET